MFFIQNDPHSYKKLIAFEKNFKWVSDYNSGFASFGGCLFF